MIRRIASIKKTVSCILLLLIVNYIYFFNNEIYEKKLYKKKDDLFSHVAKKPLFKQLSESKVLIFNLSQELEPSNEYVHIICEKSKKIFFEIKLCTHSFEKNIFLNQNIRKSELWEEHILRQFIAIITKCSQCLILDIGAYMGQYTLISAKLGRDVIAVEPFYENILKIHKAYKSESVDGKIKLFKNAISNKRNQVLRFVSNKYKIGVISQSNNIFLQKKNDEKYFSKTILFDDLIQNFPIDSNGDSYKKLIIKINIKDFDLFAFEGSKKLFFNYEIIAIFMKWKKISWNRFELFLKIDELIRFFRTNGLVPYSCHMEPLNDSNWKNWPDDVIWLNKIVNKNLLKI